MKQTDINVSWPMVKFRNAAAFGKLTLAEKERGNKAYAEYKTAYDKALQEAGGNSDAPTPENVKQLANHVIEVLAAIPYGP